MTDPPRRRIPRFDAAERITHWAVAIAFLHAAMSGLSLWSPKLYWIAGVLGGGAVVRATHPFVGLIFVAAFARMFFRWKHEMHLDADDKVWLANSHKYAMNQEQGLPEVGKYNGGQKMMFWMQSLFALLLLASGVVLWFPEWMPRAARLAAVLIHPLAAIGAMGGIILHIYMGTAAVPGSVRAMVRGWVTPRWAAAHHPKWYRQILGR